MYKFLDSHTDLPAGSCARVFIAHKNAILLHSFTIDRGQKTLLKMESNFINMIAEEILWEFILKHVQQRHNRTIPFHRNLHHSRAHVDLEQT